VYKRQSSFSIRFDAFTVVRRGDEGAFLDFDLGAAAGRQGIAGTPGESGVISPADVVRRSGATPEILGFSVARFNPDLPAELSLSVTGAYYGLDTATLTLSDGTVLSQTGAETVAGTGKPGGATPSTSFHFPLPEFSTAGTVRLSLGPPSTTMRGDWTVSFHANGD
jgi:hypothetical protein